MSTTFNHFAITYTVVNEKTGHYIIGDNFVNCKPIFTIFAPLGRELHFQQNLSNISHFTLTLVPHYLGKFKILICLKTRPCALCDQYYVVSK